MRTNDQRLDEAILALPVDVHQPLQGSAVQLRRDMLQADEPQSVGVGAAGGAKDVEAEAHSMQDDEAAIREAPECGGVHQRIGHCGANPMGGRRHNA